MKWHHPSVMAMGIVSAALGVVGAILILEGTLLSGWGAIGGSVMVAMFGKAIMLNGQKPETVGRIGPQ